MKSVMIGKAPVRECDRCGGLWLDVNVFQLICADREHQSLILGDAFNQQQPHLPPPEQVRYVPCPHCRQLMNRLNFAKCSGVIVDVCKGHGTWFDRDELRQIVEFLRGGGMNLANEKLRHEIEFEQEKLRGEQLRHGTASATLTITSFNLNHPTDEERLGGLSAARDALKFLFE